jgi:hypothetical protein
MVFCEFDFWEGAPAGGFFIHEISVKESRDRYLSVNPSFSERREFPSLDNGRW